MQGRLDQERRIDRKTCDSRPGDGPAHLLPRPLQAIERHSSLLEAIPQIVDQGNLFPGKWLRAPGEMPIRFGAV